MGWQGRKKISGINTQYSKRGLRLQKQFRVGPFQWNLGGYFGGTEHGKITSRGTGSFGPIQFRKEKTVANFQAGEQEKTNDALNDVFGLDTRVDPDYQYPYHEVEEEPESDWWWDTKVFYVIMLIATTAMWYLVGLMQDHGLLRSFWAQLPMIPMYGTLVIAYNGAKYHYDRFQLFSSPMIIFAGLPFALSFFVYTLWWMLGVLGK